MLLLGTLIALASVIADASAVPQTGSRVRCSWRAVEQGVGRHLEGTMLGTARCNRSVGIGRFRARYVTKVTFPGGRVTASETDHVKLSFKRGTMHGAYRISGLLSGHAHAYHGTFEITGGTGRFRGVTGTLKLACTDRPPDEACDASGTIAGM
jgi:hypothetical protein